MRRATFLLLVLLMPLPAGAQDEPTGRARDRGDGVPLSIFGTYVRPGALLLYPFFEYYRDGDYEYEAGELGFVGTTEHRGRYRARESLFWLAYGLSSRAAIEFEAATISASLEKSSLDDSGLPATLKQSGLGDVEAQFRWRWAGETDSHPEVFSYFETVFPIQQSKLLIATPEWEFKLGTGIIRGYHWGTITARAAFASTGGSLEPGEYAFEYLKRVNSRLRAFAAVEGSEDELELIAEAQISLSRHVILKLNNAFGLTNKATDWAPEVGVLFSLPLKP
jgi:hypothetical protein